LSCVRNLKVNTVLTTCYAAGLRISEATHIDSQRMVIRVECGKGGNDRYVMLSEQLLQSLRAWWRLAQPKDWLFPGRVSGQPLTVKMIQLTCQKVLTRSGLTKPVTPHSMRHYVSRLTISSFGVKPRRSVSFIRQRPLSRLVAASIQTKAVTHDYHTPIL
jgi:site-specific recombinase XerD